jgi:hypothetical protein
MFGKQSGVRQVDLTDSDNSHLSGADPLSGKVQATPRRTAGIPLRIGLAQRTAETHSTVHRRLPSR